MNIELSSDELAFQAEVRKFFEHDYPRDLLAKVRSGQRLDRADHVRAQQALQSRGWLGVTWSKEAGGPGWTAMQRYLFDAELERVGAPNILPMAVIYVGPVISHYGTAEQKQRWLPDILSSKVMWAQGYSEPESGSDLASLGLSAQRDGDSYILNGTKIWTSYAQWADWIFCLARTARTERKHEGISFICADMHVPGVTVQPIVTMNGSRELNRVVFDNVRVPIDNRIGAEGDGWAIANFLLQNERLSYAHIARRKEELVQLRERAAQVAGNFAPTLLDDPLFSARLTRLEIEVAALEISVLRALTGSTSPAAVSALKIQCTECAQHATELFVELAGPAAAPYPNRDFAEWAGPLTVSSTSAPMWLDSYMFERAQTIYGGATEIQKNIIWKSLQKEF
jgi:alkylation response protein AidB-like acyl-CoA dehydrogenase